MHSILRKLVILTVTLFGGNAIAIDPTDEDVSYLPQTQLQNMAANRYGYDREAYRKCMAGIDRKAAGATEKTAATCRLKATPKKCRELTVQPPEKGSKSAQEICAAGCRTAKAESGGSPGCSLN